MDPKLDKERKELNILINNVTSPTSTDANSLSIARIRIMITRERELLNEFKLKIVDKLSSSIPKEVIKALDLLDECMFNCGVAFQREIGQFRFLNEVLKLVLPNHKGNDTPNDVKNKILQLFNMWRLQYPQEAKINDAYEMLLKNGVKYESSGRATSDFQNILANKDVTKNDFDRIPKKLLNSTDPRDVETANAMVARILEDNAKKIKLKSDIKETIDKVLDTSALLREMLKPLKGLGASEDEKVTIKELYRSCKELKSVIATLAQDEQIFPDLIGDIFAANDLLTDVCSQYLNIRVESEIPSQKPAATVSSSEPNDLDILADVFKNTISSDVRNQQQPDPTTSSASNIETNDILSQILPTNAADELTLLQPIAIATLPEKTAEDSYSFFNNSSNIDLLGETENKLESKNKITFNQEIERLVEKTKQSVTKTTSIEEIAESLEFVDDILIGNNNIDKIKMISSDEMDSNKIENEPLQLLTISSPEELPLSQLSIDVNTIQPGDEPPKIIHNDSTGLKIVLHFAKDKPRDDVNLIVVNTTNQGSKSISKYYFDASVSKPCKIYLREADGNSLPAVKPFRPPTEDVTQIILISNKEKNHYSLTCIFSYFIDGDLDPVKECIKVDNLPYLDNH